MFKPPVAVGLALLFLSLISLSFCSYRNTVTQFDVQPLPKDDDISTLRTEWNAGLKCTYPTDCYDILRCGRTTSGVFRVFPFGLGDGFLAYCDMKSQAGGWLVFQRRQDGSVNFNRNWQNYTDGFGNILGEFWFGLEKLHLLTSQKRYELLVNLGSYDDGARYARYDRFYVSRQSRWFLLLLGTYSGDAGDSLRHHNGYKFSTPDEDRDAHSTQNCAYNYQSGWWFVKCLQTNLNGLYANITSQSDDNPYSLSWYHWANSFKSMQFAEMKLRPYV